MDIALEVDSLGILRCIHRLKYMINTVPFDHWHWHGQQLADLIDPS